MSDGKIVAWITIPCGATVVLAVLFIQHRASQPTAPVGSDGSGLSAAVPAATPKSPVVTAQSSPAKVSLHTTTQPHAAPTRVEHVAAPSATAIMAPPKPFRGVEWGSLLGQRRDMSPADYQQAKALVHLDGNQSIEIKDIHTRAYLRAGDKLQFGTVQVGGIEYRAFDGRFYEISIQNPDPFSLATVFSQVYGSAKEWKMGDTRNWEWAADNGQTRVVVFYERPNSIFPNGLTGARLTNLKLEQELSALQRAEAIAELEKAKKDF